MSHRILLCVAFSWLLLLCGGLSRAQDVATGAVRGVIEDPVGARLSQARVQLVDAQHGITREKMTDDTGAFLFDLLSPGVYSLRVDAPGMAPLVQDAWRGEVGDTLNVPLRLHIPAPAMDVSVSEGPAVVQTQPSAVSSVIAEED